MVKVEFPVYIKGKKQFDSFMQFLEKNGVKWKTGLKPTEFDIEERRKKGDDLNFPVYILYWELEDDWVTKDYNFITFFNEEDIEDSETFENYGKKTVEFKNG